VKLGLYSTAVGICFNQMTAKKGIKLFREKAVAAMFKEYKQLDDLNVLGRLDPDSLPMTKNEMHSEPLILLRSNKMANARDARVQMEVH